MALTDNEIEALERRANQIRESIIEMLVEAGSGHTAGPLGMADIFTALYFHILRQDPKIRPGPSATSSSFRTAISVPSFMRRWRTPAIFR